MTEQERFGLAYASGEQMRIVMHSNRKELDELSRDTQAFQDMLSMGISQGSVRFEPCTDDVVKLEFDFERAWRKKKPESREKAMLGAGSTLIGLVNSAYAPEKDRYVYLADPTAERMLESRLRVDMPPEGIGDRLFMTVEARWPEHSSDETVSRIATFAMRSVAKSLRYPYKQCRPQFLQSLVYAGIDRARGISLQTNPLGSCAIETIGDEYDKRDPWFTLESHNVGNNRQQIICLAGAIAVVHADELAPMMDIW